MAERRHAAPPARRGGYGMAVGDFYINSEVGKGSFAQVYMGIHKDTKEVVAIKSVELEKLNKKLKENLYGEIQILKTLRHPHIVALHDCVETPTHINLVMEYCELGDLSLFIKKRDRLSTHPATHDMARKYPCAPNAGLNEVIIRHFLKQLASALQFLRSKNYIHRDVKPQNLLLLPAPQWRQVNSHPIMVTSHDSLIPVVGLPSLPMLKLADFGFARVLPNTSLADTLCGSPLYMAPEILRYERYDAKADLWSVGTVLFEMVTGRPPTRARNHVELLRKIEHAQDVVKFPREAVVSSEMKSLIRALLKRHPTERLGFEAFFSHSVVVEPIPGLIEDDAPLPPPPPPQPQPSAPIERIPSRRSLRELQESSLSARRRSSRHGDELPEFAAASGAGAGFGSASRSPRDRPAAVAPPSPRTSSPVELLYGRPPIDGAARHTYASGQAQDPADGLGIRPKPHTTSTAPVRLPRLSDAATRAPPGQALIRRMTEEERAAQDVADMRDYVVIEKRQVEINAFADEIDANRRPLSQAATSPRSQALVSRDRGFPLSGSPASATNTLHKAIQGYSLRLFGYNKHHHAARVPRGQSPPLYNPYPAYPSSSLPVGLLCDSRQAPATASSGDEDSRAAQAIEDLATRSDVVYGFAEVKFKQLFPNTPSADRGLGAAALRDGADDGGDGGDGGDGNDRDDGDGSDGGNGGNGVDDDDYLTADAVVSLAEEAFVLYVKVLSLLAKAMDTANLWWMRKKAADAGRDGLSSSASVPRVNAVVQWVRTRFNEVLEKTEAVRLRLVDGQKRLPDTHPSHPANHGIDSTSSTLSNLFVMTAGITAEKLMYDRALDMSRAAAIREISHNDLPGCEISYVTAIRMLEVVLDGDDDSARRVLSGVLREERDERDEDELSLDNDDKQVVRKLIQMITSRLMTVRKKMQDITEAEKSQQALQIRRRSGDMTPRSIPSHASSS